MSNYQLFQNFHQWHLEVLVKGYVAGLTFLYEFNRLNLSKTTGYGNLTNRCNRPKQTTKSRATVCVLTHTRVEEEVDELGGHRDLGEVAQRARLVQPHEERQRVPQVRDPAQQHR